MDIGKFIARNKELIAVGVLVLLGLFMSRRERLCGSHEGLSMKGVQRRLRKARADIRKRARAYGKERLSMNDAARSMRTFAIKANAM